MDRRREMFIWGAAPANSGSSLVAPRGEGDSICGTRTRGKCGIADKRGRRSRRIKRVSHLAFGTRDCRGGTVWHADAEKPPTISGVRQRGEIRTVYVRPFVGSPTTRRLFIIRSAGRKSKSDHVGNSSGSPFR